MIKSSLGCIILTAAGVLTGIALGPWFPVVAFIWVFTLSSVGIALVTLFGSLDGADTRRWYRIAVISCLVSAALDYFGTSAGIAFAVAYPSQTFRLLYDLDVLTGTLMLVLGTTGTGFLTFGIHQLIKNRE